MAKWVILDGARDEDDPCPWLLTKETSVGIHEAVARVTTLAAAKRFKAAIEWLEALEEGRMSIPTKRKPAAPKSGSKPKAPVRARRK